MSCPHCDCDCSVGVDRYAEYLVEAIEGDDPLLKQQAKKIIDDYLRPSFFDRIPDSPGTVIRWKLS